jgi:hypothetical protein
VKTKLVGNVLYRTSFSIVDPNPDGILIGIQIRKLDSEIIQTRQNCANYNQMIQNDAITQKY